MTLPLTRAQFFAALLHGYLAKVLAFIPAAPARTRLPRAGVQSDDARVYLMGGTATHYSVTANSGLTAVHTVTAFGALHGVNHNTTTHG